MVTAAKRMSSPASLLLANSDLWSTAGEALNGALAGEGARG